MASFGWKIINDAREGYDLLKPYVCYFLSTFSTPIAPLANDETVELIELMKGRPYLAVPDLKQE